MGRVIERGTRPAWCGALCAWTLLAASCRSPTLAQDSALCALQVQAKPNPARDIEKDTVLELGRIVGTAVLVSYDGQIYLVTAYHVVSQCNDILFNGRAEFKLAFGDQFIERKFYCNTIADLAIFQLNKEGRDRISEYKLKPVPLLNEAGRDHPEKLTLEALGLTPGVPGDLEDSALGLAGVAVGNPKILEYRPKNIIYSCTISEFVAARTRLKDAVKNKSLPGKILSYADNLKMLFLETLSIDKGFSGGPVLVFPAAKAVGDTPQPRLAGIVLGGNPQVFAGRYAFATPSRLVERGIHILTSTKLIDDKDEDIEGLPTYERETKWKDRVYEWGSTFSFSGTRVIEAPSSARAPDTKPVREPLAISKWAATATNNKGDHVAFLIDGMALKKVCFHGADLTNFQFVNCSFEDVCFKDAVLNGSTFVDCDFRVRTSSPKPGEAGSDPIKEGILREFGRPLMAYGVQFRNSQMTSYVDPSLVGGYVPPQGPAPAAPAPSAPAPPAPVASPDDGLKFFMLTAAPAGPAANPSAAEAKGIPVIRFPNRPFDVEKFEDHSSYPHAE